MIILNETNLHIEYKCTLFYKIGVISVDTKCVSDDSQSYLIDKKQGFQISLDDTSGIITDLEILAPKINKAKPSSEKLRRISICTPRLEILSINRSDVYIHNKTISIYFADNIYNGIYISEGCEFLHYDNQLVCLRFKNFSCSD